MMVFAQHYRGVPWMWSGVDLFFVLSGFLITGILFDTREHPHRVRNFYVRRTLRIFPLYYGVFIVLLLLTPLMHWHWRAGWLAWPLYAGNYLRFIHPYVVGSQWQRVADAQLVSPLGILYLGHLWSLCVEEQFYLLWPWVVFFVRSRRALLWICATAIVLVPLLRLFVQEHASRNMLDAELLYRVTPFRMDALLLGGLLALWYRGTQRETMLRIARWLFWISTAIIVPYMVLAISKMPHFVYPEARFTWGLVVIDFYAAILLLTALQPGTFAYRILNIAPLRWLGRVSYGAYIFHDIYHGVLFEAVGNWVGRSNDALVQGIASLLAFAITLALAFLSFRFFETPFLNLKERWTIR